MAVLTPPEGACSHAWQESEDVAEAKERAAWHEAMNRRNITPPERLQVCSLCPYPSAGALLVLIDARIVADVVHGHALQMRMIWDDTVQQC